MSLFRFGDVDDVFGQMDRMMNQMLGNPFQQGRSPFAPSPFFSGMPMIPMMNPGAMSISNMSNNPGTFMSSSFVSFSSGGANGPQVYEQTHLNRVGPGGVREERSTVRDSRTGLQKMSIGRHIQDRGHVIAKSQNHFTGDEEESNEYINIEEEEAPQFGQEWNSRMGNGSNVFDQRHIRAPRREPVLAITGGPEESSQFVNSSHPPVVASTSTDSRSSANKKLRIKSSKDKKVKKPYRRE